MKRKLVIAVTVIAASAAVTSIGYVVWSKYFSGVAIAEKAVRNALSDPDSARFRGVVYNSKTGGTCGMVNSKNRMGGYVGDTEFLVTDDGEVTLDDSKQDRMSDNPQTVLAAAQRYLVFLKMQVAACNDPERTKP